MAGCLKSIPAEMQRPGVKAAGGRVSRTLQCCMNLCWPCVLSIFELHPGILLFDLGASFCCVTKQDMI